MTFETIPNPYFGGIPRCLPGDMALGGESGTDTGWYVPLTGNAVF